MSSSFNMVGSCSSKRHFWWQHFKTNLVSLFNDLFLTSFDTCFLLWHAQVSPLCGVLVGGGFFVHWLLDVVVLLVLLQQPDMLREGYAVLVFLWCIDCWWALNRCLKVIAVRPMYSLWSLSVYTVSDMHQPVGTTDLLCGSRFFCLLWVLNN